MSAACLLDTAAVLLCNAQEALSIKHLAEAAGTSVMRQTVVTPKNEIYGARYDRYMNALSGEDVDIIPSRYLTPGTMIFGLRIHSDSAE